MFKLLPGRVEAISSKARVIFVEAFTQQSPSGRKWEEEGLLSGPTVFVPRTRGTTSIWAPLLPLQQPGPSAIPLST